MTNDLETMLRASLRERADDVEPTPELWRNVQARVARRRGMPLLVWTAAGVAAAVTAVAVVPGLLDGVEDGLVIDPAQSPTAPASPGEVAPGPVGATPLSHYVAVVDGRLVLRGLDGSASVLWEGESEVRTVAVRPGSTPEDLAVAYVTSSEGMFDLRVVAGGELVGAMFVGPDTGDGAVPAPVWSPDGGVVALAVADELHLVDVELLGSDSDVQQERVPLAGVDGTSALRLQDWASGAGEESVWFTSPGELYRAPIGRVGEGWDVGPLERADGDDDVVDLATAPDGTQYRLTAGGSSSGDAEDAGLALEFDNERIELSDLATASPADVWMTATDGGAIVGLGSDARLIVRDREGDSPVTAVSGVSYAAWVPGTGSAPTPAVDMEPTTPDTGGEAPAASTGGVLPYVVVDEEGRLAVHTGDGGDREVILDEQLWAPEAGVSVIDATVRPGSTAGEVSGVALLATEAGPELLWFRAAAGATATGRMEGATGLGAGDTQQRDAPTWSPDGRHIAWVEPDGAGAWTLRTVGMADDGPTTADAAFGLDIPAERVRIARWTWQREGADGTARGELSLVGPDTEYVVPVERQGDGALAVGSALRMSPEGRPGDELFDLGARGDEGVLLVREGGRIVLWQEVATELPFADVSMLDLDLDVLDGVSVVVHRPTGEAYVVDRAGEVAPLGVVAHGFDPVR